MYKQFKSNNGKVLEADIYTRHKRRFAKVRFFAWHIYYRFCLEDTSFDEIGDFFDNHYKEIQEKEYEWLDDWERCND